MKIDKETLTAKKELLKENITNNSNHIQPDPPNPRFHSLKNSVYYIKKVAGSSGTGLSLKNIINPPAHDEQYTIKDLYIPEQLIKQDLPSITNIVHWHQPLGNVAKGIYKGVKDLMDVLYKYYLMQLTVWESFILNNPHTGYIETVHLTGTLITWMAQEHPEWLKRFVKLVRGNVTGNPDEKPHFELFVSPYFESLASTLPMEEAVRQTRISIDVMNFFGMMPSGYWLVERIWEPGYFAIFTRELRKLGINKAAIDDHLFYKMSKREIRASGFTGNEFSEKDLRGYFILDDELKEKDPFYILPANRDYRQARPYWLCEKPREGGRFISYWLEGYLKGSITRKKVITLFNNNTQLMEQFFIRHPFLPFTDESLHYVIFNNDFITRINEVDSMDEKVKKTLVKLWEETQKDRFSHNQSLIWVGDGEKQVNLWRHLGGRNQHNEYPASAQKWLYSELEAKLNNHYANYLPADQLLEKTACCGYINLPFGAYKEMTWWAHTTDNQERLNELTTKVDALKAQLLCYNALFEKMDNKVITDEEILLYEKLSNTEIKKYTILLNALKKRKQSSHCRKKCISNFFLTKKEKKELEILEKGVPWKNFWLKYIESYKYHRLWLFLYKLTIKQVDNEQLKELILNLLGRATVNCGSWHGVFGGRYLANLRHDMMWGIAAAVSVYLAALEEKNLFSSGNALFYRFDLMGGCADELREAGIAIKDKKKKRIPDIIIMTCRMMVIISLKNGGTLFDWILFDTGNPLSVINTINLIREPYHDDARKMADWFKEKLDLYYRFITIADKSLDDFDKDRYLIDMDTITYTAFQDMVTSLKPVCDAIVEKEPANEEAMSLYRKLLEEPPFSGTKTKMKPVESLKVKNVLKDYDTRLPVNQIVRLRDSKTGKEIGSFDTADFKQETTKDCSEWYEIIIKAKANTVSLTKQFRVYKKKSFITFIYEIMTTRGERFIEVEIENNTNLSCLQETIAWIEINGKMKKIAGTTEESSVRVLTIFNREDNIVQTISIDSEQNRLIIQPRYSVSQGLRLFETPLQYLRYSFVLPLYIKQGKPGRITISHSLDSHMKKDEEDEWIVSL
ncbi:MAG: DUF1925 domain-containing protein [Spirochaetales bacterium]|nr:DUF1925 domain-containing protein [Spirochaetales bacterium]